MKRSRTSERRSVHDELARTVDARPGPGHTDVWKSLGVAMRRRGRRTPPAKGRARKKAPPKPARNGTRVWEVLEQRTNPVKFRPRLAPDIEMRKFELRWGNDYGMIANPRDIIHFRLEPAEYDALALMDGTRTVEEIVLERLHESGDLDLAGVTDLVWQLNVGNFLEPPFNDIEEALAMKLAPKRTMTDRFRDFARTLRIDWTGAERLVLWLHRHALKYAFRPAGLVASAGVALAGVVAFLYMFAGDRQGFTGDAPAAESLIILGLNLTLIFIHELGHAAALVHYGRRVKSAGFLIYFGSPAFFIESSESLMLGQRERIVQSAVGPYAQAVFAGIGALVALALPDTVVGNLAYKLAILNYLIVFMNLIPLLELDGYWILSDLIQVPDLRPRSLSFVRHDLFHKLRKRERFSKQEAGLAAYGLFGVLFTVFSFYTAAFFWEHVFGGLVSALWNGGVTGRLILATLAAFVGGPVIRGAIALIRWLAGVARNLVNRVRFKIESKWRIEAGELIDDLPLFDEVSIEALNELAGSVELRQVPAGRAVVRQGDRATEFFVVRRGKLQVVEEDRMNGNERVLRELTRGDSFGELAVMTAASRRATVRAVDNAEVFVIDKSSFDRLLLHMAHIPAFGPTFQDMAELRALPAFSHLEQDELAQLLEHGEWVSYSPGDIVVRKGDVAHTFYAVGSGQVDVVEGRTVKATLGPGDYFGEVGLLLRVRRTATVRAKTPARLYRLDRKGFDRLVKSAFKRGGLDPHIKARRASTH